MYVVLKLVHVEPRRGDGEFVTTTETIKLQELKARTDQLSDRENEVNSLAFLMVKLERDPKSFVGISVWEHFF
jgi:hypothetical protein